MTDGGIPFDDLKALANPDILDIAYARARNGREDEAERLYDYVGTFAPTHQLRAYWPLALTSKSPDRVGEEWATPHLKRADLHINYGQIERATELLNGVTTHEHRAQVLTGRARLSLVNNTAGDAPALTEQACAIAPQSTYAAIIRGAALLAAGRVQDAISPLTMASKERPGAFFLLGLAWQKLAKHREAVLAYRKAHAFDPADHGPANNLMPALLGDRKYRAAMDHADGLLRRRPGHTTSLAFKCIALGELDRKRDLNALADHNALIVTEQLEPPAGYPDLAAFNRALAREIAADPTLAYERNTTRFGYQTDDIAATSSPAIQALNTAIMAAAKRRANTVRKPSGHPFDLAVPQDFKPYSWGVIMHEEGHQSPHFHPHGWLSGVYYIDVPDDIGEADPDRNGWLEFGRGDERWLRKTTPMPTRQVCPKAGLLITFPSFFWHSTRPLRSTKPRISFAFDIIPTG